LNVQATPVNPGHVQSFRDYALQKDDKTFTIKAMTPLSRTSTDVL
jgi:hypothetical protein